MSHTTRQLPATRWTIAALLCATMAACGGIPKQRFVFDVLTTDEEKQPSMIVVGGDWTAAKVGKQFVHYGGNTTLELEIPFDSGEVRVTVAPLVPGTEVPTNRGDAFSAAQLAETEQATRGLRLGDPKKQLFVVAPK